MTSKPPYTKNYFKLPVEWDAIAKAAAEKMPLKHATDDLAELLALELDTAVQAAVERYLGRALTDPHEVLGRLTNVRIDGEPGETWCMDGVPLLWAGEIEIKRTGDSLHGSRELMQLQGEAIDPAIKQPA